MARKTGNLLRADLDKIVEGMTAGDVFRATSGGEGKPNQMAESIFNGAAERQGYGPEAADRVPISDVQYLADLLSEALNMGGPKADATDLSQPSAATGD